MRINHRWMLTLLALAAWTTVLLSPAGAAEWRTFQTFQPESAPLDMALSAKGKWLYVLAESGVIYVYSPSGTLKDTISVEPEVDRIEAGMRDDLLYLSSRNGRSIRLIQVDIVLDIPTAGAPFKGPADAPVTVVIFTDFQCPYCARAAELLHRVTDAHPKTVKLVFKNFPLRSHPMAQPAAAAALVAHRHGKFWEFHDRLFAEQKQLSREKILQIAASLGLEEQSFVKELSDPEIQARIEKDYRDGLEAGVQGTPTIFVNGRLLRERSVSGFERVIARELARQESRPEN
jgi:protein-disulfide isomerase